MTFKPLAIFFLMALPAVGATDDRLASIKTLFEKGQASEAASQLETYRSENPDDPRAQFLLASVYASQDATDKAVDILKGLTRAHPDWPEPYNNLAVLYARQGKLKEARETLTTAMELDSSFATVYDNLTKVYATMASIAYTKALEQTSTVDVAPREPFQLIETLPDPSPPAETAEETVASMALGAEAAQPDDSNPESVTEAVVAWAAAWSRQDPDDYLSFYAPQFILPSGVRRKDWESYRRDRLKEPRFIEVKVAQPQVQLLGNGTAASIYFVQSYRSDTYSDKVRKLLVMQKSAIGWQIISEETLEQL